MASISDILIAKGAAQANALSQRGNIYADLIKNLGGVPGQLIQDQRRQQMQDLQQREQMVRLGLLQQQSANEQQLQPGRVEAQQNENALSGQRVKAGQQDADIQHIIGSTPRKPDGSLDVDGIAQLAGAHDPGMVPHATELAQKLNLESSDYQERVDSLRNDKLGEIGMQLSRRPNDLGGFQLAVSTLADKGLLQKDQAQQLLVGAVENPGTIKQTADQWIQGSAKASAALKGENVKLGPDESLLRISPEGTSTTLATGAAKPPTEEQDNNRYRNIQAKVLLKQPISPEDAAWSKAYEGQKTLGVDRSASAAADRQATAIGAQTAQQARAQGFQESQVGRKELTDKVEQPYLTAKASAQTLRDTIAAAQGGNVVAGQLQSLEATMAAIRSQGLNRINMSEIATTEHAGSLWQNIEGWLGKKAEGQPIPASVQKDMLEFAGILDKAADKKYQDGFDAVTKRYGLKDEKPLVQNAPAAQAAAVSPLRSKAASVLQQNGFSADPSSIDTFLKNNPAFK